ncbi:ADP-ribose diphosphatase [Moritella marina ATCC 15381]|uniref:ADP-ribose pyrophosphatase n=1 Tax=Moritella marina ATCC 15381 TaxID=1202962 RepID=A0A5J6WSG3_MORMI|nr:ADP-ribose diphosphatase [Moritella marina]QFI39885.1 ADP-ribose diphosphatase [Moritella marina ATCC 15381]
MKSRKLEIESKYDIADIEIINKKQVFNGFFKINTYTFKHRLFSGGWSNEITREVFERGNAAAVIPYDAGRDEVVLIEQIRIPAIESTSQPWLLELVAGMIDKQGEDSAEVVKREAIEEAGVEIGRCDFIMQFLASPGGTSEALDLYVGEVDSSTAHGVHGLVSEGEDIRVHVVSRETAYNMVQTGRINNASTIIGIQWLQLNFQTLQKSWL